MKVKLTTSLAGARFAHRAGDEIECSAEEAKRLIAKGFAVAVAGKKTERTTAKSPAKEKRG